MNQEISRYLQDNSINAQDRYNLANKLQNNILSEDDAVIQLRKDNGFKYSDNPSEGGSSIFDRIGMGLQTGVDIGKSAVGNIIEGAENVSESIGSQETFIQQKGGDRSVDTGAEGYMDRDYLNRFEQFGKGIQKFGVGVLEGIGGIVPGMVIGTVTPEISKAIEGLTKDQTVQDLIKGYNKLPVDVQGAISDIALAGGSYMGAGAINKTVQTAPKISAKFKQGLPDSNFRVNMPEINLNFEGFASNQIMKSLNFSAKEIKDINKIMSTDEFGKWINNRGYNGLDAKEVLTKVKDDYSSLMKNYEGTLKELDNVKYKPTEDLINLNGILKKHLKKLEGTDEGYKMQEIVNKIDSGEISLSDHRNARGVFNKYFYNENSRTPQINALGNQLTKSFNDIAEDLIPNIQDVNKDIRAYNAMLSKMGDIDVLGDGFKLSSFDDAILGSAIFAPQSLAVLGVKKGLEWPGGRKLTAKIASKEKPFSKTVPKKTTKDVKDLGFFTSTSRKNGNYPIFDNSLNMETPKNYTTETINPQIQ